jgi:hypothetical protein
MRFARWVFLLAGIWGMLLLIPGSLAEGLQNRMTPPPINHPEWYYGFYGSAIAWQLVFFVISRDPAKFRGLMPVAMVEKIVFPAACLTLLATGRMTPGGPLYGSFADLIWLAMFAVAWLRTRPAR